MTIVAHPQEPGNTDVAGLLERYRPLVRKTAARWAQRWPDQWEDIAQEVTLALWRVLRRRPDVPLAYLAATANTAAHKYLSRGTSVDRPLELKRRQRWQMASLDVVMTSADGGEDAVDGDKVRRHQHPREWESVVEDLVVARLLYLELHGRLGRLEGRVLRARIRGYLLYEMPEVLGLTYKQVRNAAERVRKKARSFWEGWDGFSPASYEKEPPMPLPGGGPDLDTVLLERWQAALKGP